MDAYQRIVCEWCTNQNTVGATQCQFCGAPLDVKNLVSESGWREAPRLRDMTHIGFDNSSCQVEGEIVPVAEITLARLPLVVLNMARAQGDYYQATRGGGHGDYRHLVLAPMDVNEAVELTQRAFHLAATWRNPVLIFGDYYLAHTAQSVAIEPLDFGAPPAKD